MIKISGIYCGIGSVLIPSNKYGFTIGNCFENRKEFKKFNPLEKYFNVKLYDNMDDFISETKKIDIIISQPKCGMFSTYPSTREQEYTTHPHFNMLFKIIQKYKPSFFAIENLPKLFELYDIEDFYKGTNNEYDIFPEYITNAGYSNVQLRRRLWIIGARKDIIYTFRADEKTPIITVKDVIGDLLTEESYHQFSNHHKIDQNGQVKFMVNVTSIDGKPFRPTNDFTWGQLKEYRFDYESGERRVFKYTNHKGETWVKGFIKPTYWNRYTGTLAGSDCTPLHPKRFDPLTIRERLRFQGVPDDYKFEGIKLNDKEEMDVRKNIIYYWMTSRCIPVQFVDYLMNEFYLFMSHIKGPERSVKRLYSNKLINYVKYAGCQKELLSRRYGNCVHCQINNLCARSMV